MEVGAFCLGSVSVRDSKNRGGPCLAFSAEQRTAFVALVVEIPA